MDKRKGTKQEVLILDKAPHSQFSSLKSHLSLRSLCLRAGLGNADLLNLYGKNVLLSWLQSWLWLPSQRGRGWWALSCCKWEHGGLETGIGSREGLSQCPQLLPWTACHGEPGLAPQRGLMDPCTAILFQSQPCPLLSPCLPLCASLFSLFLSAWRQCSLAVLEIPPGL